MIKLRLLRWEDYLRFSEGLKVIKKKSLKEEGWMVRVRKGREDDRSRELERGTLKIEKGAKSQGMWAASRSKKAKKMDSIEP